MKQISSDFVETNKKLGELLIIISLNGKKYSKNQKKMSVN